MDSIERIQKILDELLVNTSEMQQVSEDRVALIALSDQQNRLLDSLFEQWDPLSEEEKTQALESKLENRIHRLAKQNQACLKEIHGKAKRVSKKVHSSIAFQLDFEL